MGIEQYPITPYVKKQSGQEVWVSNQWVNKDGSARFSQKETFEYTEKLESTPAGRWAIELSDGSGNINGLAFNIFVKAKFPGVKFTPVTGTIDVYSAMDLFNNYELEQKRMKTTKQRRQLEDNGKKPGVGL